MILAVLLAAGTASSAIDAERQFAADAQKLGQWTAFRKWSAEDAVMFTPQPTNAQAFLKDRKDPPVSVFWWPGRSFVSCDGSLAVNTGPWIRDWGKGIGYFTTIWRRDGEQWRWIYDAGDALPRARAEGGDIQPQRASCESRPLPPPVGQYDPDVKHGEGASKDGTLTWGWSVRPDGSRSFRAYIWDGDSLERVIDDQVDARPQ